MMGGLSCPKIFSNITVEISHWNSHEPRPNIVEALAHSLMAQLKWFSEVSVDKEFEHARTSSYSMLFIYVHSFPISLYLLDP